MESRQNVIIAFGILILFQLTFIYGQTADASSNEQSSEKDLRKLLNAVQEQNRKLTQQNNRLQMVWLGMQQMCSALSMQTCNCEQGQSQTPTTATTQPSPKNETFPTKQSPLLRVMTIKTEEQIDNIIPVSVTYKAVTNHTSDWIVIRKNGGMWRSAGKRDQDIIDPTIFTSSIELHDISTVRYMHFSLYNEDESIKLGFNLTELNRKQIQHVKAPDLKLFKMNTSFVATPDSDLNISSIINRDARDSYEVYAGDISFIGLNTSVEPPTFFEIMNYNIHAMELTAARHTDESTNMTITIRQPYVQYGGILAVNIPYRDLENGMIKEFLYGPLVNVYSPVGQYVVKPNTIGAFPLPKQTLVFPPTTSVMCGVLGNPRPEVKILKQTKDGLKEQKTTETVIFDRFFVVKVLALDAALKKNVEGQYVCRATNGNQTVNVITEVTVLEPAVFDEKKTGVMKNTSDVVVISCKARGKPRPKLHLMLNDRYGTDVETSGLFQVNKTDPNKFTSRITFKFSPADHPDTHSVHCVSSQGEKDSYFEKSTHINVFPDMARNYTETIIYNDY